MLNVVSCPYNSKHALRTATPHIEREVSIDCRESKKSVISEYFLLELNIQGIHPEPSPVALRNRASADDSLG